MAYLTQEKKNICPTVYLAVFMLISLLPGCLGLGFFPQWNSTPLKERLLPSKQKKCSHGHVFLSNEHFLVSLEFYWTLFLFLPLQLDNSDLWFLAGPVSAEQRLSNSFSKLHCFLLVQGRLKCNLAMWIHQNYCHLK